MDNITITILASGSGGNCAVVSGPAGHIMLDCGIAIDDIRRKSPVPLTELAGCLISHSHKDHCKAIKQLMRAGVDCHMSVGTAFFTGGADGHRRYVFETGKHYPLGGWTVAAFPTFHDAEEPLGFLLADDAGHRILYATDTGKLPYIFPDLTHIMLEVNHDTELLFANMDAMVARRVAATHMSLDVALEFLQRQDLNRLQEVWLLHLSEGNSDAAKFKSEIQKLTGKPVYVAAERS